MTEWKGGSCLSLIFWLLCCGTDDDASGCLLCIWWSGFACMIGFGAFFAHWAAIDPRSIAVDRFVASQNAWTASGLTAWNATATSLGAPAFGGVPLYVSFVNPAVLSATLLSLNLTLPLSSVASGLDGVAANYTGGWAGPGFLSHTNGTIPGTINAISGGLISFSFPSVATPVLQPLFECTVVDTEASAPAPPGGVQTKLLTTGPGARGHRRALLRTSSHTTKHTTYYRRTVKRLTSVGLVATPPPGCVAGACAPASLYIDQCSTSWSVVEEDTQARTAQSCYDGSLGGTNMVGATIAVTLRLSSDPVVIGGRLTTCRGNFGLTKERLSMNAGLLLGFSLSFTFCCCFCKLCLSGDICYLCCFVHLKRTPRAPPAAESKSHYDSLFDAGPVRYIKLRRADGLAEHINIVAIDVLDVEGNSIKGISASLDPQYGTPEQLDQFGPQLLVDGVREEFTPNGYHLAHTEAVPTAWMLLDLGSEQLVSKVIIFNRTSCCSERINGLVLELSDDKGTVVFTSAILEGAHAVYTWSIQKAAAAAEQEADALLPPSGPAPAPAEDELNCVTGFAEDGTLLPQPVGPRVIPCQKIFWHKHILGLPSDTLAWPQMAPLNGMPTEHRVCSVCLQGDDHATHLGTKWRCTEGCNFDVCESCGTMEHISIDNVVSVAFSDTQHWCYKCFSFAPCLGQVFSCLWSIVFSLIGFFVVLPCKLLCCIETSVCHCLFGERLDHAAAEQAKKEAEEKLAAQRNAASNEATALGMINEANAMGAPPLYQAPAAAVMFRAPPIPGIMRPFVPEAYHNPYGNFGKP